MLEINGIKKNFGGKAALAGVDLEVRQGEVFVLLGPTGAGKTTMLRVVAGLEKVDDGQIVLKGHDITAVDPMERDMAMVFEGLNLIPVLSVRDNIAFALRSDIYREDETEIERRLQRVSDDLHIGHLLDRDVETLSGGEKQRVAVARAMVRRPVLFLLDEPLSALDLKLREELRVELRQLHERHGSTILYATHDYHGAAAIADRIGIINDGKVYQLGPLPELLENPNHRVVGELLGSPSMAFFPARRDNGEVRLDGLDMGLAADALRVPVAADGTPVLLGVWPEDVEVSLSAREGMQKGVVYATDFRGTDRAIQVQAGDKAFRKVVELDFPGRQGDDCWFGFAAEKVFVFDHQSGARINGANHA
jgi:ABC-type sugar transport system ATPase subunit